MRSLARPNKLARASAATVLSDNKVALGCRSSNQLPRVVISQLSLQTGCWRVQSMVGTMISRRKRCNQQSKQIHNLSSRWCAECLALSSMCFCFNRPSIRVLHWAGLLACTPISLHVPVIIQWGSSARHVAYWRRRPPAALLYLPALSNVWLHCAVDLLSLCPSRREARYQAQRCRSVPVSPGGHFQYLGRAVRQPRRSKV